MLNPSHDKSIVFYILHALMSHTGGDMTNNVSYDLSDEITGITLIPHGAKADSKPLNDNFTYLENRTIELSSRIDSTIDSAVHQANVETNKILNNTFYSIIIMDSADVSGTKTLLANNAYSITPTDAISFILSGVDMSTRLIGGSKIGKFHQILVQLKLTSTNFINASALGAKFIDDITPSFSSPGYYDIIYEYNNSDNNWYCGVLYKGSILQEVNE